jgi:hypothetical protein
MPPPIEACLGRFRRRSVCDWLPIASCRRCSSPTSSIQHSTRPSSATLPRRTSWSATTRLCGGSWPTIVAERSTPRKTASSLRSRPGGCHPLRSSHHRGRAAARGTASSPGAEARRARASGREAAERESYSALSSIESTTSMQVATSPYSSHATGALGLFGVGLMVRGSPCAGSTSSTVANYPEAV